MDTRVQPRDVILIHIKDEAAFYARVEEILPDRKVGWRQMRFKVLTLPLQEMTWILEPSQIDGEPFTMGGAPIRIERLPDPSPAEPPSEPTAPGRPERPGEVISFPPQPKK
jgi:hypothetical protein